MIVSVNPYTAQEIARFEEQSDAQVDAALSETVKAQELWSTKSMDERAALLRAMAKVLRAGKTKFGKLITEQMGKPVIEAEAEVEKCALNCDFYAEHAPKFLEDDVIATNATDSRVGFDPLGVVLAIMPWNYPFWQYFRF